MTDPETSQVAAQNRFLRLLSTRAEAISRRLERFAKSGWDINGLSLIHADASQLGDGSIAHGIEQTVVPLRAIAELIEGTLQEERLPDEALGTRLCALAQSLRELAPPLPPELQASDAAQAESSDPFEQALPDADLMAAPIAAEAITTQLAVPEDDEDIWGDGAARFGSIPAQPVDPVPPSKRAKTTTGAAATAAKKSKTRDAEAVVVPAKKPSNATWALVVPSDFRIYHLTGHGSLSLELDQMIEAQGLEIEMLEDVDELNELLSALPADLVLIDACFSDRLEGIGATVRLARANNNKQRLLLVAFAEADDIMLRLSARRAGVDALIVDPVNAEDVLKRLQPLVDPEREEAFRILIVEDDRSQALFAEGILRNAGMDSLVVTEALDVMPSLKQFDPDLILMDVNMPGANGIELTALIREQEAFAHTPIVFLSGESNEDVQFDAIDAGGDDFLSKPIRPRHLIAAVQTRVRRHRKQEKRRSKRADKDAATGLFYRKTLLEHVDECLRDPGETGGLIFVEVENLGLLRDRIGLTALESMLTDVSRVVASSAGELPATRIGDGSYLMLDRQRSDSELDSLATLVRQALMQNPFQALDNPFRLRVSMGVCAFRHGFASSAVMINAVEKVAREARTHESGVRRYEPPRAAEAIREAALLAQIREALDQDSLVLLYQPVVAVAGNEVSQYQALLRVRDSNGKLRPAAEIIPIAERTGLIVDIDRWVIMQSLSLIKERLAENQALSLFVTQSPLTLGAPGQGEWLREELISSGVPDSSLVIELRLDDVTLHSAAVQQFCKAMLPTTVQFCLSQFEASTEAEAMIEQLPLSFVKIARKYTTGNLSPALRDELKGLINNAHRCNLQVIGHGVEDAQAAATLWMSGIDFIQGNLVQHADEDPNFDFNQAVL